MSAFLKAPSLAEVLRFGRSGQRPANMRISLGLSLGAAAFGGYPALTPASFDFDPAEGIRFGTATKLTGTGPVVTVSGTRDRSVAELLSGGIKFTVLSGGTTMNVSFDNGTSNAAAGVSIPAGSTYAPPSPNGNLTFTFASGTYVAGDTYEIAVEQWTDKIGAYVVLNTTNAQQPRYFVTGLGGKPYLDFDGTDDRLIGTSASVYNLFQDAAMFTLLQRLASDTPNAVRVAFSAANSTVTLNNSRRFGTNSVAGGAANSTWTDNAGAAKVSDGSTGLGTGVRTFAWQADGTAQTLSLKLDGAAETISNNTGNAPTTLTPNRYGFGGRVSSTVTSFWDGKIGRHVGFASVISDVVPWLAAL